jgi:hypothetical protein
MKETKRYAFTSKQKAIYIAGPMSGYAQFNFPAFMDAAEKFKALGYEVWNPAAKDGEDGVLETEAAKTGNDTALMGTGWSFEDAFLWDITKVIQSRAIYMLKGWEQSMGAAAEHAVAVSMKRRYPDYEIMYQ